MPITISGSTGVAGVDGSAGTPAIQGGDTNTGMFFPAADTIAFAEGGAEVMRLDSSGNLVIGNTTALAKLDVGAVGGTDEGAEIRLRGSSGGTQDYFIDVYQSDLRFAKTDKDTTAGAAVRFQIGSSGQWGIGGASYGTSGQVFTSGGSGAAPSWTTPSSLTLLGTITTTSGTTQSLTSLSLTDYSYLYISVNGVSSNTNTDDLSIVDGAGNASQLFSDSGNNGHVWNGTVLINLTNGSLGGWGLINTSTTYNLAAQNQNAGNSGTKLGFGRINQTTASTSIGFRVQTAFDAGTIVVYGVR